MCLPLNYGFLERVWQCSCGCFSNNFSCQNTCQWFFLFFKNHFLYQHIKTIQNVQTILNFSKKKIFKFFENTGWTAFPNASLVYWRLWSSRAACRVQSRVSWTWFLLLFFFIFFFSLSGDLCYKEYNKFILSKKWHEQQTSLNYWICINVASTNLFNWAFCKSFWIKRNVKSPTKRCLLS